jgi:hypothetical protein
VCQSTRVPRGARSVGTLAFWRNLLGHNRLWLWRKRECHGVPHPLPHSA